MSDEHTTTPSEGAEQTKATVSHFYCSLRAQMMDDYEAGFPVLCDFIESLIATRLAAAERDRDEWKSTAERWHQAAQDRGEQRDYAVRSRDRLHIDAIVSLVKAGIATPEEGYLKAPHCLSANIEELARQRDAAVAERDAITKDRAVVQQRFAKSVDARYRILQERDSLRAQVAAIKAEAHSYLDGSRHLADDPLYRDGAKDVARAIERMIDGFEISALAGELVPAREKRRNPDCEYCHGSGTYQQIGGERKIVVCPYCDSACAVSRPATGEAERGYKDEWVSVAERLPELWHTVWTWNGERVDCDVSKPYDDLRSDVTHWKAMEPPTPPAAPEPKPKKTCPECGGKDPDCLYGSQAATLDVDTLDARVERQESKSKPHKDWGDYP